MRPLRRITPLVVVVASLSLAACSDGDEPTPTASASAPASPAASPTAVAATEEQIAACEQFGTVQTAWDDVLAAARSGEGMSSAVDTFIAEGATLEELAAATEDPQMVEPAETLVPSAEAEDFEAVETSLAALRRSCRGVG